MRGNRNRRTQIGGCASGAIGLIMIFVPACETRDVGEISVSESGSGYQHCFVRFSRNGMCLVGDLRKLVLTLVFIYEASNHSVQSIFRICSGIEGNKEGIVQMGKSGSECENEVIIGNGCICLFNKKGNIADSGNISGHGFRWFKMKMLEAAAQGNDSSMTFGRMDIGKIFPDFVGIGSTAVGKLGWGNMQNDLGTGLGLLTNEFLDFLCFILPRLLGSSINIIHKFLPD